LYLSKGEQDVPQLHNDIRLLGIAKIFKIAERPSNEAATEWLSNLEDGSVLSKAEQKVARTHFAHAWSQLHRWYDLVRLC
jgi:hypothetical protein